MTDSLTRVCRKPTNESAEMPVLAWGARAAGSRAARRYFGTVKATENCRFSHMIFSTPPPAGLFSMARVS